MTEHNDRDDRDETPTGARGALIALIALVLLARGNQVDPAQIAELVVLAAAARR